MFALTRNLVRLTAFLSIALLVSVSRGAAADPARDAVASVVNAAIEPLMKQYAIAGMTVGVIVNGNSYVFNYGIASRQSGQAVTNDTLFEVGSISKTLTATLASYAAAKGRLSLVDAAGSDFPSLHGTHFGDVSLVELGTHTPGGLPLQVPANIHDDAALIRYLQSWKPRYVPGTYRTYSNISIGMLGVIAAERMGRPFEALMEHELFPALGMGHTYIDVPASQMQNYAEGYRQGVAIRMKPDVLWKEAYGVRTTATDLLRFIQANMNELSLDAQLTNAVVNTHIGYFRDGVMTQDLIWEQYPYPVSLNAVLAGNSATMLLDATPVRKIVPPLTPQQDVWIDKTGSTNGFGSYVAYIPKERLGLVLLANENYPIPDRVRIAYKILTALRP